MHKRPFYYILRKIRRLSVVYLALLLLATGLVFLFASRANNLTAIELRDKVLLTDKENGDTEAALRNLRQFTYAHMNTSLEAGPGSIYPPVQLKYRYERLVAAEQSRVDAANGQLYTRAQDYCEQQISRGASITRIPCIQEYLDKNDATTPQPVPDALYKFAFAAPMWSPDLAGWSLLAVLALAALLALRLVAELLYRAKN